MSAGLIIGIILVVVVLCIIVSMATRSWTIRKLLRDRRRETQIYLLPPPVQTRSVESIESTRGVQAPFLPSVSADAGPRARSYSDAISTLSDISSHRSEQDPRHIAEVPAYLPPTTPATQTTQSIPFSPMTTETDHRASMTFAHVPSRTPGITKAKTFRSEVVELSRSRASSLGSWLSSKTPGLSQRPPMPPMPPMPELARSQTGSISEVEASPQAFSVASLGSRPQIHRSVSMDLSRTSSTSSSLAVSNGSSQMESILHSPATGTYTLLETPVVGTAVAYEFRMEQLARASVVSLDTSLPRTPTIPAIAHVAPMYIPYRPAPSG